MVATWRSGGGGTEDSSFLDDWWDEVRREQGMSSKGTSGLSGADRTKNCQDADRKR